MAPNAHAKLGASNAKRWMACPGSVAAEAAVPARENGYESPHAAEGTKAHAVAEWCLRGGHRDPSEYPDDLPDDMLDGVRLYVETVGKALAGRASRQLLVEVRLSLEDLDPPSPMFGTADAIVVDPHEKHVHVLDLKYGKGVYVETDDNPQLLYYALGAVLLLKRRGIEIETITVTIVQPRYYGVEPVRSVTYSRADVEAFAVRLMAAARATQEPDAPRVAGEHCRFCRARPACPAQWELAQTLAQSDFNVVVSPPSPRSLSDADLRRVLDIAPIVEEWFDDVRDHLKRRAEDGDPLPGTKLVATRARREWTEEGESKARQGGFIHERVKTPAEVEREIGRKDFKDFFASYTTKVSSGTILVSADDPRPAIETPDDMPLFPQHDE